MFKLNELGYSKEMNNVAVFGSFVFIGYKKELQGTACLLGVREYLNERSRSQY